MEKTPWPPQMLKQGFSLWAFWKGLCLYRTDLRLFTRTLGPGLGQRSDFRDMESLWKTVAKSYAFLGALRLLWPTLGIEKRQRAPILLAER